VKRGHPAGPFRVRRARISDTPAIAPRAAALEAKRRGGDWLFFLVSPGNRGAQTFYNRLGARAFPATPLVIEGAAFERLASQNRRGRRAGFVRIRDGG